LFPLLLGLAAVGSLVAMAVRQAVGPSHKMLVERERFEELKAKPRVTLDEAEDGLVLARRFGDKKSEVRFGIEVRRLRKLRPLI